MQSWHDGPKRSDTPRRAKGCEPRSGTTNAPRRWLQRFVRPTCHTKLNAITVPTNDETTAPTPDRPSVAAMRFEVHICGRLKKRTPAETAKPTTRGKPKTTKSESVHNACDTARLR